MSKKNMYHEFFGIKINESLEEADLINKISDYQGGVLYKLIDPASSADVRNDIQQFAAKKKMHIIKTKFDDAQGIGFFYFRLGEDPGKESQRIQGFVSQLPEVLKFKFTTLKKSEPTSAPEEVPTPEPKAPVTTTDKIIQQVTRNEIK
tara:strand:- start:146 stop:589 length:444 start_codon:yes stop_codon:yes gene_type:complete